jgi:hypothetical protein
MIERGGRVKLSVIPSRRGPALSREVRERVNPEAIIFTDDWQAYKPLRREFLDHRVIPLGVVAPGVLVEIGLKPAARHMLVSPAHPSLDSCERRPST